MRPRIWLQLLMILTLPQLGQGQVVRFDTVRLNPVNSFLVGYSVFEVAEGYQVFATGGDGTGDVQNIRTEFFDVDGNFQYERIIDHPRKAYFGSYSPVAREHTGVFASGVVRFEGAGSSIDSLFLYQFNTSGDTISTDFLVTANSVVHRKCIRSVSGDFLLVGLYSPLEAFLCRASAEGALISFDVLDEVPAFFAMSIAEAADQDLYICGYGQSVEENNSNNANLIKCAPDGTTIWRRTKPRPSTFTQVVAVDDGGVLAIGSRNPFPNWDVVLGHGPAIAIAVKYDADGNEQWSRDIISTDTGTRPCGLTDGFHLQDGSFVVAGTIRNTTIPGLWDNGMLHKLDAEGTVLWSRYYAHYTNLPVGYAHIFNAVQPTSDGGFILTGEAQGPSPPNRSRLWLVKLDSMGCLVPGCHTVGVEEFETQLQSALVVSPNPASEHVTVELALPKGYRLEGTVQLMLLDVQGKEVLRQNNEASAGQVRATVDVGAIPSGLYYVHLRDASKWLAGGKVVVE